MKKWLELYNSDRPNMWAHKFYNDITSWDVPVLFDIDKKYFFNILKMVWLNWEELEPVESKLSERLNHIVKAGHDIDVVTSVLPTHIKYVKKWLEHWKIPHNNVIQSDDKLSLNYDIYIDDRLQLFEDIFQKYPEKTGIMYSQPWNSWDINDVGIVRLSSWEQIVTYINGFKGKKTQ